MSHTQRGPSPDVTQRPTIPQTPRVSITPGSTAITESHTRRETTPEVTEEATTSSNVVTRSGRVSQKPDWYGNRASENTEF